MEASTHSGENQRLIAQYLNSALPDSIGLTAASKYDDRAFRAALGSRPGSRRLNGRQTAAGHSAGIDWRLGLLRSMDQPGPVTESLPVLRLPGTGDGSQVTLDLLNRSLSGEREDGFDGELAARQ